MPPLLCLDFGSAYTKVALRRDTEEPSVLVKEGSLSFDELNVCIPTVVAVDQRSRPNRWKCGIDAVDVKDSPGIKVYSNWKKHLFSPTVPARKVVDEEQPGGSDFLSDLEAAARERKRLVRQIARVKGLEVDDVAAIATKKGLTLEKLRAALQLLRPGRASLDKSDAGAAEGTTDPEIRQAALMFFKWLQLFVQRACQKHGVSDIPQVPVRVCVPAFGPDDSRGKPTASEELLLAIMGEAGWRLDKDRPIITEPFADSIGTLTEGMNRTWVPDSKVGKRFVNMREMFTHKGLFDAYRRRALEGSGGPSEHVMLVIDIGAYTSDFAALEFDLGDVEAPPWVSSNSEPMAIDMLDREVVALLEGPKKDAVGAMSLREREELKSRLYVQMRPYATPVGEVGEGQEGDRIRDCIGKFGDQIAAMAEQFLDRKGLDHLDELVFTGGGNNIPLIRSSIYKRLRKRGVKLTHIPHDKTAANAQEFHHLNQLLVRGASALGGASVFFDHLLG